MRCRFFRDQIIRVGSDIIGYSSIPEKKTSERSKSELFFHHLNIGFSSCYSKLRLTIPSLFVVIHNSCLTIIQHCLPGD